MRKLNDAKDDDRSRNLFFALRRALRRVSEEHPEKIDPNVIGSVMKRAIPPLSEMAEDDVENIDDDSIRRSLSGAFSSTMNAHPQYFSCGSPGDLNDMVDTAFTGVSSTMYHISDTTMSSMHGDDGWSQGSTQSSPEEGPDSEGRDAG